MHEKQIGTYGEVYASCGILQGRYADEVPLMMLWILKRCIVSAKSIRMGKDLFGRAKDGLKCYVTWRGNHSIVSETAHNPGHKHDCQLRFAYNRESRMSAPKPNLPLQASGEITIFF